MKEKKARVEDAMHATKAAVEEGIVPGGGVALIRASKALDSLKLEGDQKVGANIIRKAIEEPLRWIATNAGQEGSIVVQKVKDRRATTATTRLTDKYENLVTAGVIDPVKVVRTALQNASSIASLLLTTEALVSEIPEEKKESAGGGMPGGGGMGGMYRQSGVVSRQSAVAVDSHRRQSAVGSRLFHGNRKSTGREQSRPAFLFTVYPPLRLRHGLVL